MLKVEEIREIIKLIDESSIDEFSYETNGTTVKMKKNNETGVPAVTAPVPNVSAPVATQSEKLVNTTENQALTEAETSNNETESKDYDYEIVSPMVGTFYMAPTPESDPFVKNGSKVDPSTVVCIVEAMKLFNEIEAEVKGEIVEILADNGDLVEYGQPLFRVTTK
ncbi:biotin carboxyl carrier protein of acetyl-CoA carboxylase [Oceanobacillus picturae]|uniref:Biotin carboxyl carrier protein of acetyl-CoA carboxylase n=1 Tax=Oceanobacillus picturae TaxID=171693 RepID=A0A0U9H1G4_9BACI|nr:acetyl-CoA carboxylase biotin carboxyl carrier protein [Oceanobacillus picturae]RIU96072.1 acetyl-CoA carboxylase biotin carboxyl carrier protein [Oceanobacillus picturae]GAQ16382.1 biotin carboxyl carrier protein of acetyl-CoA carboxylase [Oceanobacillus picturae]